jgi:adenylate kinase family enzyme
MNVLITGASASGTTTLGKSLAELCGLPFFDADDYYWSPTDPPYRVKRERSQRLSMLVHELNRFPEGAVVAGSVVDWGAEIEDSFAVIVFLIVPAEVRLGRLRSRELARFGSVDTNFLAWAAQYDDGHLAGRSLAVHQRWLAQRSCRVLRIKGDISVEDSLQQVILFIRASGGQL